MKGCRWSGKDLATLDWHQTVIGAAERGTNLVRNVIWHGGDMMVTFLQHIMITSWHGGDIFATSWISARWTPSLHSQCLIQNGTKAGKIDAGSFCWHLAMLWRKHTERLGHASLPLHGWMATLESVACVQQVKSVTKRNALCNVQTAGPLSVKNIRKFCVYPAAKPEKPITTSVKFLYFLLIHMFCLSLTTCCVFGLRRNP